MQFEYLEPATIEEAVLLLSRHNGRAKIIAGGTDLLILIRRRVTNPEYLIDISSIAELNFIEHDESGLRIGAMTPISSLLKSSNVQREFPVICKAANQFGSVAIRNVATVGGNLCNAAPSAEVAPALIGLSAKARIVGPDGERVVLLEDFFTGPGCTVLAEGELLVAIEVPRPEPNTRGTYLKHALRGTIDPATVSVAVVATLDSGATCKDIKLVLGAVFPTPLRSRKVEAILKGKNVDEALIMQSAEAAADESRPISDIRGSAEYRRDMVKVFTARAIREVLTK